MHSDVNTEPVAWLMIAAGDDRMHSGNGGYDDEPSVYYSWDSTVANHRRPKKGDVIALWDKKSLLGVSVIEKIEVKRDVEKELYRCPNLRCKKANLKSRKWQRPQFRCSACKNEFDEPKVEVQRVTTFRSYHPVSWIDLPGQLQADELRKLCIKPRSQQSIRKLDYPRFRAAVPQSPGSPQMRVVDEHLSQVLRGGHRRAIVRVRIGQRSFRNSLLKKYGDQCAFTGPSPMEALEAAHLYSFAIEGEHRDGGGLLLRRDVHRLFDCGHLAVNPSTSTVDVSESIRRYDEYGRLHGESLRVPLTTRHMRWIAEHWKMHRDG